MTKSKFRITYQEWIFVLVMTFLAIIFTNEYWLRFLATLNSFFGFLIYYAIVYTLLIIMSYFGLVIFGVKIKNPLQILGTGLILFSFFLIFDWSSDYLNIIGAENALINNSEDAVSFDFWAWLIHPTLSTFRRWLTWALAFPVTVFIATLIGVFLSKKKPKIEA